MEAVDWKVIGQLLLAFGAVDPQGTGYATAQVMTSAPYIWRYTGDFDTINASL